MRVPGCSSTFDLRKCLRYWPPLLLIFSAIIAWRVGMPSPAAAQANTKVNPSDGLTYVWISPGTFQMGCSPGDSDCLDGEKPAHSVTLTRGFWIGQTLVTQRAYTKVVGSNPSSFKGDQLPIETVSWDNAQAYCGAVGMRLPTEAEWEYAARGGSPAARYGPLDSIAWYGANSGGTTHEVGQKQANDYGLYDMLGNVSEWVADWWGLYTAAGVADPNGAPTGRLRTIRGQGWYVDAPTVRVSFRGADWSGYRGSGAGFRCAGD